MKKLIMLFCMVFLGMGLHAQLSYSVNGGPYISTSGGNIGPFCKGSTICFQAGKSDAVVTWGGFTGSSCTPFTGACGDVTPVCCTYNTVGGPFPVVVTKTQYDNCTNMNVDFTWTITPASACVGSPICFENTTVGANSYNSTITVDYGDGTTEGLPHIGFVCHSYDYPGTYYPCMTIQQGECIKTICGTVVVLPRVPEFVAEPVCVGDYTSFINQSTCFSPGSTYSWNFGDGTPLSTAANPAHLYAAAGTYTATLTVTDAATGLVYTVSHTVTVYPLPVVPVITGPTSACTIGTPVTYTITNYSPGLTYTLDFIPLMPSPATSTAVNSSGQFNVTWNTTNGGTILVHATNPATGCQSTGQLDVISCCVFGTKTFYNATSADLIAWAGTSMLNSLSFSINGTLTVNSNITLDGCTIKMGPNAKINVQSGLIIGQGTKISACDIMWDRIEIQPSATLWIRGGVIIEDAKVAVYSVNGGNFTIEQSTLNRNFKHLELGPYAGTHPGTIHDMDLTCEPNLGTTPLLNPPYSGYRTHVGIECTEVNAFTIGSTNLFKNMNYGIYSNRSSLTVIGNTFTLIDMGITPNVGVAAIKAIGNPFVGIRTLNVGNGLPAGMNYFTNCINGVQTDLNMNATINKNDFKLISSTGIHIKNCNRANTVLITTNDFETTLTGVYCQTNPNCSTRVELNKFVNMTNNSTGIRMFENSSSVTTSIYNVYNNQIKTVQVGIKGDNLYRPVIEHNKIEVEYFSSTLISSVGIQLANNSGTTLLSNTVDCIPASTNLKDGGILANTCPGTYMRCNILKNSGYGIKCVGNMVSDLFNNQIIADFYGIWLDNNCVIGTQDNPSSPATPSYNKFTNVPLPAFPTTSFRVVTSNNTNGSLSPFVYHNGLASYFVTAPYCAAFSSSTIISATGSPSGSTINPPCPAISFPRAMDDETAIAEELSNEEEMQANLNALNVYPNPSTGQFTFEFNAEQTANTVIEIYDLLGKQILSEKLSTGDKLRTVSMDNFNSGIYFYRVIADGQLLQQAKIVLTK
jgi:hypothetical protein